MDPIYLDYAATTPVRSEVRAAMAPHLDGVFGNPSSTHRWGREAAAALAEARDTVATVLGARFSEIVFTRGGTESDNAAVCGRARWLRAQGEMPSLAVTAVEHKAVLDAAEHVSARGAANLTILDVAPDGSLDMEALEPVLERGPALISVMWVNNETGMVLPVPEVVDRVRAGGGTVHTDAVQAVGKIPVRVDEVPVDLLTVTGHKIYGPKGTGALYVRQGVSVAPLLHGGGQELGLRPGTEDVAGAIGLATALRLAVEERDTEGARLVGLRQELEAGLSARISGLRIHGADGVRAPHITSVGIPGVDGTSLLMALDLEGLAVSGGSACQSGSSSGSHVLEALYGSGVSTAAVRFSLGRDTTADQVARAHEITAAVVSRLRGSAAS